jgi:microcystin-dependent protein
MAQPFVAQVSMFGFNFAPTGWALCQGQLLSISQNTALFSLLGTNFGGDGKSTFGLPDFRDRAAVDAGQGNALSDYPVGEIVGAPTVTLNQGEMALHNHSVNATTTRGNITASSNNQLATGQSGNPQSGTTNAAMYAAVNPPGSMNPQAISLSGGGQPHNNMQPFLTINFCIALQGVYPARP